MIYRTMGWLVLAAAMTGCGRVHELYYLRGNFGSGSGPYPLDQVYVAPNARSMEGKKLVVRVENPGRTILGPSKIGPAYTPEYWKKFQSDFEQVLANRLSQTGIFAQVRAACVAPPMPDPGLDLRVAVTQWHEGTGWLRAILGFGLGRSRVQWEGAIVDRRSRKVLFSFADARIHPGGPSLMGVGRKVWRGDMLITEDLRSGVGDLMRALRSITNPSSPPRPALASLPVASGS